MGLALNQHFDMLRSFNFKINFHFVSESCFICDRSILIVNTQEFIFPENESIPKIICCRLMCDWNVKNVFFIFHTRSTFVWRWMSKNKWNESLVTKYIRTGATPTIQTLVVDHNLQWIVARQRSSVNVQLRVDMWTRREKMKTNMEKYSKHFSWWKPYGVPHDEWSY